MKIFALNIDIWTLGLIYEIDLATEEAAKNVATTYDRLGFILKHDKELEDEFIQ